MVSQYINIVHNYTYNIRYFRPKKHPNITSSNWKSWKFEKMKKQIIFWKNEKLKKFEKLEQFKKSKRWKKLLENLKELSKLKKTNIESFLTLSTLGPNILVLRFFPDLQYAAFKSKYSLVLHIFELGIFDDGVKPL